LEKLNLINSVGVAIAFIAVVRFYLALGHFIAHRRPLAKIVTFKIVIGLTFIEEVGNISELQILTPLLLTPIRRSYSGSSNIHIGTYRDTHLRGCHHRHLNIHNMHLERPSGHLPLRLHSCALRPFKGQSRRAPEIQGWLLLLKSMARHLGPRGSLSGPSIRFQDGFARAEQGSCSSHEQV